MRRLFANVTEWRCPRCGMGVKGEWLDVVSLSQMECIGCPLLDEVLRKSDCSTCGERADYFAKIEPDVEMPVCAAHRPEGIATLPPS